MKSRNASNGAASRPVLPRIHPHDYRKIAAEKIDHMRLAVNLDCMGGREGICVAQQREQRDIGRFDESSRGPMLGNDRIMKRLGAAKECRPGRRILRHRGDANGDCIPREEFACMGCDCFIRVTPFRQRAGLPAHFVRLLEDLPTVSDCRRRHRKI